MAGTRKKHQVSAKYGAGLVSEEKSKHTGRVPVPNPQQLIALVNRHELIKKGFAVPCLLKLLNQVGGKQTSGQNSIRQYRMGTFI